MLASLRRLVSKYIEKKELVRFHINRNDKVGMLHRSWGLVFTNLLEGAYYEFGVYKGATFIDSWKEYFKFKEWAGSQINSSEHWRREMMKDYVNYKHEFYGFDTFSGMPDNKENNRTFAPGSFFATLEEVEKKCKSIGMRYRLFKGLFSNISDETLIHLQPAAIVNIDADLYSSALSALEKVRNKMQQGTILLMDDYHCFSSFNSQGERRALREFCEKYPKFKFEPWLPYHFTGQTFICHISKSNQI